MITGPLMIADQIKYTDMTPLAHLINEYVGFGVRPDAPYKTGRDVIMAALLGGAMKPGEKVSLAGCIGKTFTIVVGLAATAAAAIVVMRYRSPPPASY